MDSNAIAGFVTVSCSRTEPASAGGSRSAERAVLLLVDDSTYHAVCPSCFRQSPIVGGGERAARAHVVELGWTVTVSGALYCPVCARPPSKRGLR
jgi:hypothetical protein